MDPIKRNIIFAGFMIALVIVQASEPPRTYACSCGEPDVPSMPKEIAESYNAVFTGRVISVREDPPNNGFLMSRAVVFEVMSSWKDHSPTQIMLHTGRGGGDCGFDFQMDSTWLVYAYVYADTGEDNVLHTGLCDPTRLLSSDQAKLTLASLGEGKAPTEQVRLASPDELSGYRFINWFTPAVIFGTILVLGVIVVLWQRKREKDPNY